MTVRILTDNSVYELDQRRGAIRRVSGTEPPTECFAPDGDWKRFRALSFLEIGRRVQVVWPDDAPHDVTVLSVVRDVQELNQEESP
jgi:hypothetical protein